MSQEKDPRPRKERINQLELRNVSLTLLKDFEFTILENKKELEDSTKKNKGDKADA